MSFFFQRTWGLNLHSYSMMDAIGSRLLLGDAEGALYFLTLGIVNHQVDSLCFIGLGSVSFPLFQSLKKKYQHTHRYQHHPVWLIWITMLYLLDPQ